MIDLIVYTLTVWFVYYLLNHAEMDILIAMRQSLFPLLPGWLSYSIQCAFCFTFWSLTALSLFFGYAPVIILCPPCVLMWDLAYRKLKR